MPRHARFRVDGYPYHVIQRGNNRTACFVDDVDRHFYLNLLAEFSRENGCDVHAYVLMTNHIHLLVTPDCGPGVSQFVKNVSQRYAQRFNRKYERTGCLWEGRFRSSIVDSGYAMICQRYIELNPVRAGMAPHPALYPWSSYHANARGEPSSLVRAHSQFQTLGPDEASRRAAYVAFLEDAMTPAELERIRNAGRGGFALGGPEFAARLEALLGASPMRSRQG